MSEVDEAVQLTDAETLRRLRDVLRREQRPDGTWVVIHRGRVIEQGPRKQTEEEKERSRAIMREMHELAKEISKSWSPDVSAVEAVREQRRY